MHVLVLLFFIVTVRNTVSQTCNQNSTTVELNNRTYRNKTYGEGEYFVDEAGIERGCVCLKESCLLKCCHLGYAYDTDTTSCVRETEEFDPRKFEGPDREKAGLNAKEEFYFYKGKLECTNEHKYVRYSFVSDSAQLLSDGRLKTTVKSYSRYYDPKKYCIDNFYIGNVTIQDGILCYTEILPPSHITLSASGMLVSCFFIMLTVVVYIYLPELRRPIAGKIMMAVLLSFLVHFLLMASLQIWSTVSKPTRLQCTIMTFVIYFGINLGFFWMNIMCFDVWMKFRKINTGGDSADEARKFLKYCAYAFSMPTILTIVLAVLEFSGLKHELLPNLRTGTCFMGGTSKLIYLCTPMVSTCIANVIFVTMVVIKILKINRETQQRLQKTDKERFIVFLKLFVLTGFTWVLEAVSDLLPQYEYSWRYTDAYNVLFGLIVFIMFICNKKVFTKIKNRFRKVNDHTRTSSTKSTTAILSCSEQDIPLESAN